MTEMQTKAIAAIEEQQAKMKEDSCAWTVGEQLKDICRAEPRSAELLAQDLKVKGMGLADAERKIAAFAKKHGGSVSGRKADRILREFYGLAGQSETAGNEGQGLIHLEDFF